MILEIDAGNSRIKWRLCSGREVVGRGVDASDSVQRLLDAVSAHPGLERTGPSRIRIVSVRGAVFERIMLAMVSNRWSAVPEFARSATICGHVVNGYERPSTLGVDRWLAMVSAFDRAGQACCVVDAGSAITLDLVSGQGKHEGGYIVPGLSLQRDSFVDKTGLQLEGSATWQSVAPGLCTQDALDNGILGMAAGWIVFIMQSIGEERALYLTGGDASVLSEQLDRHNMQHFIVPDLVLDGLALTLP